MLFSELCGFQNDFIVTEHDIKQTSERQQLLFTGNDIH